MDAADISTIHLESDRLNAIGRRLAQWRVIAAGKYGLVNQSTAAWLLDVSKQRVSYLLESGRIEFVKWEGLAMIPFSSVEKYAIERRLPFLKELELQCAKKTSLLF